MAGNKDWNLNLNVSGIGLFEPGTAIDRLPGGVYAGLILSTERDVSKTPGACDNVMFEIEVAEAGPHKGKKARIWMPIDPNVGEGLVGKKWKNILVTVAKDPSIVEKGGITLVAKTFEKKPIYLHVQEVPGNDSKGRPNLPNLSPITKEQYEKFKAEGYGSTPAGAVATGAQGASMEVRGGAAPSTPATPQAAAVVALE